MTRSEISDTSIQFRGYDGTTGRYRTAFTDGESISTNVVLSVSAVVGTEPTQLPGLYETLDPNALDSLFTTSETRAEVTFSYAGCIVTVRNDGSILITPPNPSL
ncbi:HalOD1 output domain-containing protein (plasmid) [Haloferacaceae archaeon DSL9]